MTPLFILFNKANYLVNMSLIKVNLNVTHEQMFIVKISNLSNLRAFGCEFFVLISKDKIIGRIAFHVEKCVSLGYKDRSKVFIYVIIQHGTFT